MAPMNPTQRSQGQERQDVLPMLTTQHNQAKRAAKHANTQAASYAKDLDPGDPKTYNPNVDLLNAVVNRIHGSRHGHG